MLFTLISQINLVNLQSLSLNSRLMKKTTICLLMLLALFFSAGARAQQVKANDMHKVKRNETIFGIAKQYGLTVDELIRANPDMNQPGYDLKKGDYIVIPASRNPKSSESIRTETRPASKLKYTVKAGVVLPLHNVDGDGRRMIEYYRGLLMACEDLKRSGLNIEISAYNTPNDGDIYQTLAMKNLAKCDIIFGPLYTKQVKPLADFARSNDIKLVIPFSISGNDVLTNPDIFQVYQSPEYFNNEVIRQFATRFANYNVVVIDCNDRTSDKGNFTFNLRRVLTEKNIPCSITNLTSSDDMFAKAFSTSKPNMVILNTGRSPELNQVLAKLDILQTIKPAAAISMFGYTEWLMYVKYNQERFCRYDTYIPTNSFYNSYSPKTRAFESRYISMFNNGMMDYLPRFALTGYDHGIYFLQGIAAKGKKFTGAEKGTNVLQTPLHFVQAAKDGGYQNNSILFVHFNRNNNISIVNF